jgi:adenosylcobinamide-phosphate synthase
VGAAAGLVVDRALGEPPSALHPVAGFGRLMIRVERVTYDNTRQRGLVYAAAGAIIGAAAGRLVGSTALAVAATAAGRMLRARATAVRELLDAGDLDGARAELPALVGREPSTLDASGVAAAAVESVAENTVDAVVAPALWGAACGAVGACAFRAINTMDSMVGNRSERYERFGWGSARLDDAAAFLPARLTAAMVGLARPARAAEVWHVVRRDAGAHPSPNAGVAEAAFAGALGVELGGPLTYAGRLEDRPRLGGGRRPESGDIARAVRLAGDVETLLAATLAVLGVMGSRARRQARATQ